MRLFGSSGIRGLTNVEITPLLAQKVGAAIASKFEGGAILIGRDTRLSGEMLEKALVSGIVSCGFVSGTLGIVPTPVVAWLTKEMRAEAGISISASHNPPQYNGLKIFDSTGMAYTVQQQRNLEEIIEKGQYMTSSWNRIGSVEAIDAGRIYVDSLVQQNIFAKEWNIICDLFNGATCTVAPDLFKELGIKAVLINAQPDGHFPAGNPEPSKESLIRLGNMVSKMQANIGFGFDGDGDRMMAVDEKGQIPSPDRILAAYARYIVEANGGGVVVTHVGTSMSIEEAVDEVNGNVVRTKVGDVHITEAMNEHDALFGGEPVGAWIHPDFHMCPDGILSAMKLMLALETMEKNLSEFISNIPEYPILRDKIHCSNKSKKTIMASVSKLESEFKKVKDVSTIDGIRLQFEDSWLLIRPSGTEPIIRITVEAHEKDKAEELLENCRKFLNIVIGG
jgi:phosphoglucosamine mutase